MAILFLFFKRASLLFLLTLSSIGSAPAQTSSIQPPILGRLVNVGGYRVHIYCSGTGSPSVVVASGGFSVDWGLVQPEVSKFTQVCTYDPAGVAWSDKSTLSAQPGCHERVTELRVLLQNAGIQGPYVMVGFSIGGLIARLYADRFPAEVSGMVLVDHAFIDTETDLPARAQHPVPSAGLDSPPMLISKSPISLDLEDDVNFAKLPKRDQDLHRWALSIHSERPTVARAAECFAEVERADKELSYPLGKKPLAVVSTLNDSPHYIDLQHKLLMLSQDNKQFIAGNSSHMVIIDQPEVVIQAIREVVTAVRNQAPLRSLPHASKLPDFHTSDQRIRFFAFGPNSLRVQF